MGTSWLHLMHIIGVQVRRLISKRGGSFLDKVELSLVGSLSAEVNLERLIIMGNIGNGEAIYK